MGDLSRFRGALAVVVGFGLTACTSTGLSVGKSAGVSAAGGSFATAGSCSMFPAIKPGDRLRFDSDVGTPQRGDIVSYRANFPGAPAEMVHRVVGLPGEHLERAPDGRLLVNGAPLVEGYLPAGLTTYMLVPVDVPADHWFMLGDNRDRSSDSRVTGPIPRADIHAKVTDVDPVKSTDENHC